MTPQLRTIDSQRWQPRCFVTEDNPAAVLPPQLLNSDLLGVAVLVDLILTRIVFLAQVAPGRFDK